MVSLEQLGQRVHFIGIGGVSMSGLAEILHYRGLTVTGSDRDSSDYTRKLEQMGVTVYIGHKAGQEAPADTIVYNSAIPAANPEYSAAKAAGKRLVKRSELLGAIMGGYQQVFAVAGTHGKTTASSMLSTILVHMGKDPTIHIGSALPLIGGATRLGGHGIFVAEACEYQENFLDMQPTDAVILNIDADHLDYYRDIDHIQSAFAAFLGKLPPQGCAIINGDDPRAVEVAGLSKRRTVSFGFGPGCDLRAFDEQPDAEGCYNFQLEFKGYKVCPVQLSVPGRHQIYNAMAAMAAAAQAGIRPCDSAMMISEYRGAGRRFAHVGQLNGAPVIHDYAHHPAEVECALQSASLIAHNTLWCIFQPHTYTRTKALFDRFSRCFGTADQLILLDIYAAREADPGDISSAMLCRAVAAACPNTHCTYQPDFAAAIAQARACVQPGDLVLTLGAGDIDRFTQQLIQ